eukprot:1262055-Rhodomonas_salina.3
MKLRVVQVLTEKVFCARCLQHGSLRFHGSSVPRFVMRVWSCLSDSGKESKTQDDKMTFEDDINRKEQSVTMRRVRSEEDSAAQL